MGGETSFGSSTSRCTRVFNVFNTFFIILALGAFVAMALILNEYNKNLKEHMDSDIPLNNNSNTDRDNEPKRTCGQNVDIAIVGAGASGAYAAWKLSAQYPDKSIHLYEANNRIGGRLYSVHVPDIDDFVADLGAMRFYRELHELVFRAIDELELEVINFTTPKESEKIYHLRGEYLLRQHLDDASVPYHLSDSERNISGQTAKIVAMWNRQSIRPNESDPSERITFDGKNVYKLGNYNEWLKAGSYEGLKYIADISGYDYWIFGNRNLAQYSFTEYEENSEPSPTYLTLRKGTNALPKAMVERFLQVNTRGNKMLLNHELLSINSASSNISFTIQHTETKQVTNMCTKQLILAFGATALEHVDWPERTQNAEVRQKMEETTTDIPAVKVYLAYDSPWWRTGGQGWAFDQIRDNGESLKMLVTDLPLRMIIDIGEDSTTGKSLLLVYNDYENNLNFWRHHMEQGERDSTALDCEFTPSVELVNLTQSYLAKILNISKSDMPLPYASIAHAWYDKPYYGGWHIWSPGMKFTEVQDDVLKPLADREIYVIGEAYSAPHLQGWVEGAYERAEAMLQTHFRTTQFQGQVKKMYNPDKKYPPFGSFEFGH